MKWTLGKNYKFRDISCQREGELIGFLLNQSAINWKDKEIQRNHPAREIYLVLKTTLLGEPNVTRFCFGVPIIYTNLEGKEPYSSIEINILEYGESIEQLKRKLQNNYVFCWQVDYEAKYKENFEEPEL